MSIGSRLNTVTEIAEKIKNRDTFADIGSDHAHLAIEMVKRGIYSRAIASDINTSPLESGRKNALTQGVSNIEFILSDGFDALEGRDISAAAICGMGGELIASIVLRSGVARRAELILQPMTMPEKLRKALWENGFTVISESYALENKKPYVIIHAKYSGVNTEYSYSDLYLGKASGEGEEYREYVKKVLTKAKKQRIGAVARGESTDDTDSLILRCQEQITSI